jgi:hypothetical protein
VITILYKNQLYTPVAEKKTQTGVFYLIIINGCKKWLFFKIPKTPNQWYEFLAR